MTEAYHSQAVRTTELCCLGFACSQLAWSHGIRASVAPKRLSLTSGLFQQAANSDTRRASDGARAHLQCRPIGACISSPETEGAFSQLGTNSAPNGLFITHLLSFESYFLFSHEKARFLS